MHHSLLARDVDAVAASAALDAEIARRARQSRAIAELGQAALSHVEVSILIGQTCALVEEVLEADRCAIIELIDRDWQLRFSVGSKIDFALCDEIHEQHLAQLLYIAAMPGPMIFRNLAAEPRFDGNHLLAVHGVQAGVGVRIAGRERPFGVLLVYSGRDRLFLPDEVEFLQSVADLTGAMIESARADDALAASEQRFRALVENSTDGIFLIDAHGTIHYAGPSTCRILGFADSDLVGKRIEEVIHPDDVPTTRVFHAQLLSGKGMTVKGEVLVRHATRGWRAVEAMATNLLADPAVAAIVINYRDVTERKDAERQLERLAYRDSLTGLPNRFLFHDRLHHGIDQARRRRRGLGVMYLDLDRFKLVNDTLGHSIGDELLQAVAARLTDVLRVDDTIARLGGDEFAILLPDIDRPEDAGTVATKVVQALRAPFVVGSHQLYAPGSIGVSLYPADGEDVTTLLKNADSALYRAKELGRNNVQLFAASMNERYRKRLDLEVALRSAVERQELELHYQPIIDRRTGRIRAFEALMRWRRGDELVSPSAFIGIAEETGLIVAMGDWALDRACADLRAWRAGGAPEFGVAVNLSAHQLQQPEFIKTIHDTILRHNLAPYDLELEVTESAALQNLQWTLLVLDQLRSIGVRIAVDDFGTGQSSLAYLKRFPLHTVKMDREFLRDLSNPSDAALISSIIDLVHSLDLYVVAEGVETMAELRLLNARGCDGLQGYFFSKPMPANVVPEYVAAYRAPADGMVMVERVEPDRFTSAHPDR